LSDGRTQPGSSEMEAHTHGMKIIRACLFDGEGKEGEPLALPSLLVPVTRVIALMLRHLKTRK